MGKEHSPQLQFTSKSKLERFCRPFINREINKAVSRTCETTFFSITDSTSSKKEVEYNKVTDVLVIGSCSPTDT